MYGTVSCHNKPPLDECPETICGWSSNASKPLVDGFDLHLVNNGISGIIMYCTVYRRLYVPLSQCLCTATNNVTNGAGEARMAATVPRLSCCHNYDTLYAIKSLSGHAVTLCCRHTELWSKYSCANQDEQSFTSQKVLAQTGDNYNKIFYKCTYTQPFYGSVEFVRDNPGEPVPEETFTHSHSSWSSIIPICFLHLLRTMASSVFNPRALQSFFTIFLQVVGCWRGCLHGVQTCI